MLPGLSFAFARRARLWSSRSLVVSESTRGSPVKWSRKRSTKTLTLRRVLSLRSRSLTNSATSSLRVTSGRSPGRSYLRRTFRSLATVKTASTGSVRNATTELKKGDWISQVAHYTEMLRGDFSEVDKNHPRREIPAGPLFRRTARPDIPDDHETVNGNH